MFCSNKFEFWLPKESDDWFDFTSYSEGAKEALVSHFWQGNADELINAVQRAFIVGEPPLISESDLGLNVASA